MTKKELIDVLSDGDIDDEVKIVVVKQKKRGGYKVFPQVVGVNNCTIPILGECFAIIYEE